MPPRTATMMRGENEGGGDHKGEGAKEEDDDDLDADLALFEKQLQSAPDLDLTAAVRPKPSDSVQLQSVPTAQPVLQQNVEKKSTKGGNWRWDGAAWRWVVDAHAHPSLSKDTGDVRAFAPVSGSGISMRKDSKKGDGKEEEGGVACKNPSKDSGAVLRRTAAGRAWSDHTFAEWPADDHRLFVGNLAPDATDMHLIDAFGMYSSYTKSRVVRDKRSGACRGYGFVSFADARDLSRALKEMNGKYVGGRPVKLKRSTWQKRTLAGDKWKELKALRTIAKK